MRYQLLISNGVNTIVVLVYFGYGPGKKLVYFGYGPGKKHKFKNKNYVLHKQKCQKPVWRYFYWKKYRENLKYKGNAPYEMLKNVYSSRYYGKSEIHPRTAKTVVHG